MSNKQPKEAKIVKMYQGTDYKNRALISMLAALESIEQKLAQQIGE